MANKKILSFFITLILCSILTLSLFNTLTFTTSTKKVAAPTKEVATAFIDVPLENQNEGQPLGNGCEITSLSMLLRYYGYATNKNQLAELLEYVPVKVTNELYGNPHDGFVGDISGGFDAMGVAVEPIAKVAETIVQDEYTVMTEKHLSFKDLEKLIHKKIPVWVQTTVEFQIPQASDFRIWNTSSGEVQVTPLCHTVVVTGVDSKFVYVNDPFGFKHRAVDKEQFKTIYQLVGEESLYLLPTK